MADVIYPFKKYNYKVEIGDMGEMGFSEISGGDISYEPIEYREGNFPTTSVGKQQGIIKYSNITLKYGLTENNKLYEWINSAQSQTIEAKDMTISLLADNHKDVLASWTMTHCIPIKLALSDLSANGNEIAIESVDFAVESIVRNA